MFFYEKYIDFIFHITEKLITHRAASVNILGKLVSASVKKQTVGTLA